MPTFQGTWSYRSFRNDPDLNVAPNDLLFGAGTLVLTEPQPGKVAGTLGGPGWSLDLEGVVTQGNPTTVQFTGKGVIGGEDWQYSYLAYVVPDWPNGVDQVDALVGSIIRDIPHSGGSAEAGYVASFYAPRA